MIANFKFAPRSALLFTLGPWACGVFAATARAAPASPPGPEKISYGVEAVLLVVLILSLSRCCSGCCCDGRIGSIKRAILATCTARALRISNTSD